MRCIYTLALLLVSSSAFAQIEISSSETTYRFTGEHRDRAHNVELTATKVDGTVVAPGATFSYNEIVGERSKANGFRKAHVIREQKLVDDWGGGACQLASTLHRAVLYAGLHITESQPHSLASTYMQPSLDSTVAWPNIDFKFVNDTDSPVTIHVRAQLGVLTVKLESLKPTGREVVVKTKILKRKRRPVWKIHSERVKKGVSVSQSGSDGLLVERRVTMKDLKTGTIILNETKRFSFASLARIVLIPKQ